MPRNSTGVYSLPIGAFSPGNLIKANDHNTNNSDIATALTQSLATTGVSQMTGPIKAASGVTTAPSITFASGTTTGFYLAGTNQMGFTAGGVTSVLYNADGSVTFNSNISIAGSLAVTGGLTVGGVPIVPPFVAGTRVLLAQAAAPTGWTQVTAYTDLALRLVSGTGGGTGGTKAFSSIFNASITNLAYHWHTVTDPGHGHTMGAAPTGGNLGLTTGGSYVGNELSNAFSGFNVNPSSTGISIVGSGTGLPTAFDVGHLDVILCQKN